ncbi:dihydropyrimidinase [Marinitoga hydrogenitolerans DSM 16785]|uniref:Dihydropyrimidinase n=1 Tax=Marinitoga hydrogenitolerans (strain DSM 16785 / JCM 12826 / AT1271) TaxID=1122195 RepID=A0A1M4ZUZ7_MARH1|nr:amidohydrolase family protein [Marinitoga hydrogenitolerans]SHF21849.1 dihydropyrimidinase [Marinitoga hydrogenitolerans DSM 16785]
MFDLGILNGKIYISGKFIEGNIYIKNGKIYDISKSMLEAKKYYDISGKYLLPGFIDSHVHFHLDLGNFISVDDFSSGSISAAYGGITTYIDFLAPVRTADELERAFYERLSDAKKSVGDYAFHATIANPTDEPEKIISTAKKLGLSSIKLFTTYSSSNRRTYDDYISKLLELSRNYGIVILIHSENDEIIRKYENNKIKIADHSKYRPTISELSEVIKLAEMSEYYNAQLYIVHLTSGKTLEELKKKFNHILGKNLVIESCPHYFYFTEDIYNTENGYLYTMTPPLRSEEEQNLLIDNIEYINTIGTDHCSFYKKEKAGEYINGLPMGIGGVEFSFVLMYTKFGERIIDKFTRNVARYYGLNKKGEILPSYDADLVVFDPDEKWEIKNHHSKSDYIPYENFEVKGKIISTISKGKFIIKDGILNQRVKGSYIKRREIVW